MGTKKISYFKQDLRKIYLTDTGHEKLSLFKKIHLWINSHGLQCVAVYRFSQWTSSIFKKNKLIGLIPHVVATVLQFLIKGIYHVNVEAADIGPGFYIGHIGTIYIGRSKIGPNFSISHNVTLGNAHGEPGSPTVGNNVWIGNGATLAGKINIGNGVTVSSGSVVTKSIPDNCLVVGNPGRVIMQNYDNSKQFAVPKV